jgi:hypothetical protein
MGKKNENTCEHCGDLTSNPRFCSNTCSGTSLKKAKISSWLSGEWDGSDSRGELSKTISNILKEQVDYKCSQCGWGEVNPASGKVPVQVDHIDGDSTNNSPSNLRVLCPNCHSITPTYGALNANGRGRRGWRKKYNPFDLQPIIATDNKTSVCSCGDFKDTKYEFCIECFLDPERREKKVPLCSCGNKKDRKAKMCLKCRNKAKKQLSNYPPIEEIIEGVRSSNMRAYAASLGKSDNAVRKHLERNGVAKEQYTVIKSVFCSCGTEVSRDDIKAGLKTCVEHRANYTVYPPIEEIAEGIKDHGFPKYAKSLGLAYPSSLRKYLERRGVNWHDLVK